MADQVFAFSDEESIRKVAKATRMVLGLRREIPKPSKMPRTEEGGGCASQNCKIQVMILGLPTDGTFDMLLYVGGASATLTFNWDDNTTDAETTLATHPNITSSDIIVNGFSFPVGTMEVEFVGDLANTPIALPYTNWTGLTGGTGVGIICLYSQLGHE